MIESPPPPVRTSKPMTSSEAPWRSKDAMPPYRLLARELCLMAIVIERDWRGDDTTALQDVSLQVIADSLRYFAKMLRKVFDASETERSSSAEEAESTSIQDDMSHQGE